MKLDIPNFDPTERAGKLKAIAALLALVTLPPAGLWVAGNYRHDRDVEWCSAGSIDNPQKIIVDKSCVARREAKRWGPFLAFGPSGRHSTD